MQILKKRKVLVGWAIALSLLLAACGEQTSDGKTEKLLINEVYTNTATGEMQWVELFNNTSEEIDLAGWKLVSSKGEVALTGKVLTKPRYFVVSTDAAPLIEQTYNLALEAATEDNKPNVKKLPATLLQQDKIVVGKLDPDNELVLLKHDAEIVDQVGWGNLPNELKLSLGLTNDINLGQNSPKGANLSLGRTPNGAVAPGGAQPGLFTLHSTPSPGSGVPKPEARYDFFLGSFTDIVAGVGGLMLWFIFILIAFIARRFQVLAEQKTYWEWLMAAPIGIAIYDAILVWNYVTEKNLTAPLPSWTGFGLLFLSGVACLYVINIFRLIARNILESE